MKVSHCLLILSIGVALHVEGLGNAGANWIEEECVEPMGMESGRIPASRISASSSFDEKSVGPQNARIRQELNGGAWCPKNAIADGVKEYLEIDFGGEYRVTQTESQGRFGNSLGKEFTEQFQLEYYRDSLGRWVQYKDHFGRTIFEANRNTYLAVIQKLNPPVIATRIRFIPYSLHMRTVCMRVESYGCQYTEGVIHYECPQGYWKKNPDVDLRDSSYDGWMDEYDMLRGGLGLLVDSLLGPNDFRVPHSNKGNMWIGWDNGSDPVKIGFQFDTLRKFYEVSIHVNNLVSQGAQVFASVDLFFSMDGHKFSEVPLKWAPKGDLKDESAQLVKIPLKGRIANYVRMEFHHSNHWLLLSEITFQSDIFTGNVTEEIRSLNYLQDGPDDKSVRKKGDNVGGSSKTREAGSGAIVGLIAGSLSVLVLLSIVALVCYVMRRNRRNTKLVGVMGMTPKSMSMGLGGCSEAHHGDGKGKGHHTSSSANGAKKPGGKIALCDLKPVSIAGETDSDESLYHELVFGLGVNSISERDPAQNGTSRKSTSRKIKYQRVNHGGDFSDFNTGMRGMHEELNYFHQSTPTTPATLQKQNSTHQLPQGTLINGLLPPFRQQPPHQQPHYHLPIDQYHMHHHHHPLTLSSLQSKTLSLGNGNGTLSSGGVSVGGNGIPNGGGVFTTSNSKSSSSLIPVNAVTSMGSTGGGYFHSPHRSRRSVGSNLKNCAESNYYAATDIFHVSDKHFDRF